MTQMIGALGIISGIVFAFLLAVIVEVVIGVYVSQRD